MLDNKYLDSIIILLGVFILMIITAIIYTFVMKKRGNSLYDFDLREYTLYLKYNMRTKKVVIENFQQENLAVAQVIYDFCQAENFHQEHISKDFCA